MTILNINNVLYHKHTNTVSHWVNFFNHYNLNSETFPRLKVMQTRMITSQVIWGEDLYFLI